MGHFTGSPAPSFRRTLSVGSYIINKGPAAFLKMQMSLRRPLFSAEPSPRCVPHNSPIICCWLMSPPKTPALGRSSRRGPGMLRADVAEAGLAAGSMYCRGDKRSPEIFQQTVTPKLLHAHVAPPKEFRPGIYFHLNI